MNKKEKKEYSKYVGFGLIMGVAIGFSFGLIVSTPSYAPLFGGFGAGIGIVMGSILGHYKLNQLYEIKMELTPGTYEHYKGQKYEVLGVAKHSETLEELVVYKALYDSKEFGKNALWARPKSMFSETVSFDGKEVPRFRPLEY